MRYTAVALFLVLFSNFAFGLSSSKVHLTSATEQWPEASTSILNQIEEAEREFLAAGATGSTSACTTLHPCLNGGTCFDESGGMYRCACLPGYLGHDCEYTGSLLNKEHTSSNEKNTNSNSKMTLSQARKSTKKEILSKPAQSANAAPAAAAPAASAAAPASPAAAKISKEKVDRRAARKERAKAKADASLPAAASSPAQPAAPTNAASDYCSQYSPCLHGGLCQSVFAANGQSSYKCICQPGWVGHDCALALDNSKWAGKH